MISSHETIRQAIARELCTATPHLPAETEGGHVHQISALRIDPDTSLSYVSITPDPLGMQRRMGPTVRRVHINLDIDMWADMDADPINPAATYLAEAVSGRRLRQPVRGAALFTSPSSTGLTDSLSIIARQQIRSALEDS